MKFSGNFTFNNNIDSVWDALNNPNILKKSIDGCKEFLEKEKDIYFLRIQVKIGPINASFTGELRVTQVSPPSSYVIEAKGNAGQLGGATGKVEILLTQEGSNTKLSYVANAKINGKIAQLGARLIEGTVKKNTKLFFSNFERLSATNFNEKSVEFAKKEKKLENKLIINILNKKYLFLFLAVLIIFFLLLIYYE